MKIRRRLICVGILLLTVGILAFCQRLLTPKYMTATREGALIAEYYDEPTGHDVLFLGDCEVYENFTPPTLWKEYGITSWIRGSAQQLVWQSYYLLEDTLRYETPQVVVFNVYALKYGEPQNEAYNRMTLDGMEWSQAKSDAIRASMTEDESFLSYVFPLLRFHDRWDEVTGEDWEYLFSKDRVSHNGYLMQTGVKPKTVDLPGDELEDYTLPATAMEYLDEMRALCQLRGIQLILIKAPTNSWRYYWYDEWDKQVSDYAEEYGIPYYNFIPKADEIGLDWTTDTYDAGVHLNVAGAEKLTSYFGKILSEVYRVPDRRGEADVAALWAEKVTRYEKEKQQNESED